MDLIVVPGHASFADHITEVPPDPQADEHWVLQAFQTGEPPFYIEHIKIGVDQLKLQPQARLYFSGGRSRAASHWSEAGTYDKIASHFNFWKTSETEKHDLNERTFTEEYARDSFENLLFSLCAFYQRFNTYPQIVTSFLSFAPDARQLGSSSVLIFFSMICLARSRDFHCEK